MDKNIIYTKDSAWKKSDINAVMEYAEDYKQFLGNNKTEREFSSSVVKLAQSNGFTSLEDYIDNNSRLKPGDKVYVHYRNKCVVLIVIGKEDIQHGMNITAAHIDSPRLDLKGVPFYEEANLALLKTHYYGGIKKYQWASVPLSLHGVVYTKDNKKIVLNIGEEENDPVFFISDLLIHLSNNQLAKTGNDIITAEQLNIIVGNIPYLGDDEVKDSVKYNTLKLINEKYGLTEKDFISAEIEFVPALKPRDVGFDRSMVVGYGHDDKICSYTAFTALFNTNDPSRTCVCILTDKEEIGSVGTTGLQSYYFENIIAEVCHLLNLDNYNELIVRRALSNSYVLSMDVGCLYDPSFAEAFEKQNSALIGSGTVLIKYTGSRGKSGSNDADSEYMKKIIDLFDGNDVIYQTGEIGKTDQGGGGTVAYMLARYGARTVDLGVGVLDMHSPCELISKSDLYNTYKAANAFYGIKD